MGGWPSLLITTTDSELIVKTATTGPVQKSEVTDRLLIGSGRCRVVGPEASDCACPSRLFDAGLAPGKQAPEWVSVRRLTWRGQTMMAILPCTLPATS